MNMCDVEHVLGDVGMKFNSAKVLKRHTGSDIFYVVDIDNKQYKLYKTSDLVKKSNDFGWNILRKSSNYKSYTKKLLDYTEAMQTEVIIPFLKEKMSSYNFLPGYAFCTDNYIAFDWYNDYETPSRCDFLKFERINEVIFKSKSLNNKFTIASNFLKDIICKFNYLYESTKIKHKIPDFYFNSKHHFNSKIFCDNNTDYLCVSPCNITCNDFVVKRDVDGKIIDWKFIDIGNFLVAPPRYIFCLDGKYPIQPTNEQRMKGAGHDSVNLVDLVDRFNNIEQSLVLCCTSKEWFSVCNVSDIHNLYE